MKTLFLGAASALTLLACRQTMPPHKERQVQIDTMLLVAPSDQPLMKVASNEVSVASRDSTTYIRFGGCYLSLDWIVPDDARNNFELHPDTVYLTLQPGHSLEGQMLTVTTNDAEKINVWQSYETSLVAGNYPLKQWKHHRSGWESLQAEASNFFICRKYTPEERRMFPIVSIATLHAYVKKFLGKEVYARIAGQDTLPHAVISSYYLKVNTIRKNSSIKTSKLLIIEVM
ncbi:MAG TPA: hypothetical protein VM802_13810 [Chitinophaga sp.]|uniref:hypothetical protein n=1 Tax=Chitinophaga sp. TaxID=1869181 RepID=UPI002D069FF8|nr:hypothetical protein [Chitinophaga sp.]HVI45946.1 hypothetical protein [Chitinophaga sp.]